MKNLSKGIGLIELMITVVVLVVLANFAVPNFMQFIQSNRVTAEANSLVSALNFARSEAVKRGEDVRLCASSDGLTCGGDWADGWVVRVGNDMLRQWDGLPDRFTIVSDDDDEIDFDAMGAVAGATAGNFSFSLHVQPANCSAGQTLRRTVDVSHVGRAQVMVEPCE
ncbi:GspH/FimT family pseudopilin [Wenzhouxiangella sp. AB-CW3]|uniref:GspH/FimT family pseudopilin n=1 Tax=Wenzhouxiangella sp. AB-CW3 TaxID=2771012 RepID=UPI00168BC1E6|nr:GspH/FimT family pseudopilin [Wenzhouxiangella sp. AB-CW3]QOC22785.1 GspH/FimT family pseudopilin [Wenzhouxiangella sp. AB-CW3]